MKKRGKKIKHQMAVQPFGVKNTKYELSARAAMLAIERGAHNEQHLVDIYVLAEIASKLSAERHIQIHAASVRNLIEQAHQSGRMSRLEYAALEPSANALLECFRAAKNTDIVRVCMEAHKKW
jgi:hypothetical protein